VQPYWFGTPPPPIIIIIIIVIIWGEEAQHNERAEWIRREQKRKISRMDWRCIQITEITSYFLKAHNWKSPGNGQVTKLLA
jgi:hypothetical protein